MTIRPRREWAEPPLPADLNDELAAFLAERALTRDALLRAEACRNNNSDPHLRRRYGQRATELAGLLRGERL